MSKNNDGGPAFPIPVEDWRDIPGHPAPGMTLRDWFAGQALIGLCAEGLRTSVGNAEYAYEQADAMIAQRETPND